jgi:hypothetical protein
MCPQTGSRRQTICGQTQASAGFRRLVSVEVPPSFRLSLIHRLGTVPADVAQKVGGMLLGLGEKSTAA